MFIHAEENQITNLAVKEWINELEDATYNADDLLDEIATIALRGELEAEAKANGKQVAPGQFSVLNLRNKESMLKKIVERLDSLSNQRDLLNLSGLNIQPENVMHQFGVLELNVCIYQIAVNLWNLCH